MRRIQLQLYESTYQLLRMTASERGLSMAALVRELLREHLQPKHPVLKSLDQFQFIGSGSSKGSDLDPLSERHDEALAEDFLR